MAQYQLVMKTGPSPGKAFALSKNEVILGRDLNNEIVINDAEVSRQHTKLVMTPQGYAVEDMGSTNGTYVNERRVSGQQVLQAGQIIRMGDNVTLTFEVLGDPNATVASRGDQAVTPPPQQITPQQQAEYQQVQQQQQPQYQQPPQQPSQQEPVYAGQVPAGPQDSPQPAGDNRRRTLIIGCGVLLLLGACAAVAVLWYIDSNYLWCDVFGGLISGCR